MYVKHIDKLVSDSSLDRVMYSTIIVTINEPVVEVERGEINGFVTNYFMGGMKCSYCLIIVT
jgi:hypothetical protein